MKIKITIKVEKDKETTNEEIRKYFKEKVKDAFKKGNKAEVIVEYETYKLE